MTKRDIEYNVPLRLPIPGEDTEAMFRRLVAFSYAVGRQYRADGGPAEEPGAEASRFVREELARPSEAEQAQIREITRPSPLLDQYGGYGAREAVQQNVSRPMPTAHEFVQHQLKGNEPQLPQMDREAYQRMKEYSVLPLELAAYEIPVAGQALAAVDLARSIGGLGSALRTGDKADAAGSAAEAGMAASGTRGKLAKMAAAAMAGLMPEEAEAGTVGKALRAIRAYHGSPYAFDRFDLSKIGTGEGAQAYGHGLYFSDNENVARSYREGLSGMDSKIVPRDARGDMVKIRDAAQKHYKDKPEDQNALVLLANAFYNGADANRAIESSLPHAKRFETTPEAIARVANEVYNPGAMYETLLHVDPEHLLDWDAYLSDQSPILKKAIRGIAETSPLRDNINAIVRKDREAILRGQGPISGKYIYENLGGYSRPQETSEALREAGIPGIKYLDAGSRATGEGSRNYVIFDDKLIDVLRRYAQGGEVDGYAGGGAIRKAMEIAQDIIHSQKKAPKIENLARVADKFVYHSGVKPDIEHMTPYLEPQHGSWIKEVASGAVDDPEEFLENANPLLWMSDKPTWVKAKIGRHLEKPLNQITDDDIRNYGHVALIPRKSYEAENIWGVGPEGLSEGQYSTVSNLKTGKPTAAYNTDLYKEGRESFGVERNEYISAQPIEPMYHLTGDALLNFLKLTKNRSAGGEVDREDFDRGGSIIKAAIKKIMDYKDPASKYIKEWNWRPLAEVQKDIGTSEVPEHVQNFGRYMGEMSSKAATEGLDPEDVIKAYMITRSSIQREGRTPQKIASYGIPVRAGAEDLIRPEGHMADFLSSPMGVRFLNEARKGNISQDTVDAAVSTMRPFGLSKVEPDAMDWARRNLPERASEVSNLVARAKEGASTPDEWRDFTRAVRGVGPAKTGFLGSLLGRGDLPTLDARQAILHTGMKNAEAQDIMARNAGRAGHEAVDRLAARQRALDFQLPEDLDPFYQHLAHHTVWDAIGKEKTTHQDIIDAMKPRADGGEVERDGFDKGGIARAIKAASEALALEPAAKRAISIASSPSFDRSAFQSAVREAEKEAVAAPSITTTGKDVLARNPYIAPNISLSKAGVPFVEHSYEWSPTGLLLPKKEADLADLVRQRAIITPALGDISSAETVIKKVGGIELEDPTITHGGGPYQRSRHAMGPNPAAWASRDSTARTMYNKILENAQAVGREDPRFRDSPIVMSHTTMGYPSLDSTHIVRHNILGQIAAQRDAGKIDMDEVKKFDAFMRGKLGDKFPGMLDTDALEQFLASEGAATSTFVKGLDTKGRLKAGFPDVGAARFAAMHPKLMGTDPMASGYSMAIIDPSRGTTGVWHGPSMETSHPTYGTRIPSLGYIGGTKYQVPYRLMFPDWAAKQKTHYVEKKTGELVPMTDTMHQQSMMTQSPVQRATQEWLDNIMQHVEREKKAWGYRRGGQAHIYF